VTTKKDSCEDLQKLQESFKNHITEHTKEILEEAVSNTPKVVSSSGQVPPLQTLGDSLLKSQQNSNAQDFKSPGHCDQDTTPLIVRDLGAEQVKFFGSSEFQSIKTDSINIVVSHGGYLRKLLLQTVRIGNKNPHPRNAEAYLCEVKSVGKEVRAIVIRDHIPPPSTESFTASFKSLVDQYDTGKDCTVIGSGSCPFFCSEPLR
jgi:hypothetical protein